MTLFEFMLSLKAACCCTSRSLKLLTTMPGQVFTPAGRRLLPSLHLGARPVFMSADGAWRLLAVAANGDLRLWDLQKLTLVVEASVLPLLSMQSRHVEGASGGLHCHKLCSRPSCLVEQEPETLATGCAQWWRCGCRARERRWPCSQTAVPTCCMPGWVAG